MSAQSASRCSDSYRLDPFPKQRSVSFGIEAHGKDARAVRRAHAFGVTIHIIEKGKTQARIEERTNDGHLRSTTVVDHRGFALMLNHSEGFRNQLDIGRKRAREIIDSLEASLDKGGWGITFGATKVIDPLKEIEASFFERGSNSSDIGATVVIPVTRSDLNARSYRRRNHAFGSDTMVVQPRGTSVTLTSRDKSERVTKVFTLTLEGELIYRNIEKESLIREKVDPETAEQIIDKAVQRLGAGGWSTMTAISKFSEAFSVLSSRVAKAEETFKSSSILVETTDGGVVEFDTTSSPSVGPGSRKKKEGPSKIGIETDEGVVFFEVKRPEKPKSPENHNDW